jgi:hypothetical protein
MVNLTNKFNKIYIVTSDDFGFAGWIAIKLMRNGFNVGIITKKQKKSSWKKKFALSFAFGFHVIIYILRDLFARIVARNFIIKINTVAELHDLYLNEPDDTLFLMINFDSIINNKDFFLKSNFLNFHPSLLPSYKGLGPIFWCFFESLKFDRRSFGWTVHQIDAGVDEGLSMANAIVDIDLNKSLWNAYISIYMNSSFFDFVKLYFTNGAKALTATVNSDHLSYGAPNIKDGIEFISLKNNKLYHYIKFFINGGFIGVLSWFLQLFFFYVYESIFEKSNFSYSLSVYSSFVIAMIINFFTQSIFVFGKNGNLFIFIIVGFLAITMVNLLSLFLINIIPVEGIVYFAYPLSALVISPFVFFIKSKLVFKKNFI